MNIRRYWLLNIWGWVAHGSARLAGVPLARIFENPCSIFHAVIVRKHLWQRCVGPARRGGGALLVTAEVADGSYADLAQIGIVSSGKAIHCAGPEQHAPADRASIPRAIAAEISKILSPLQWLQALMPLLLYGGRLPYLRLAGLSKWGHLGQQGKRTSARPIIIRIISVLFF